MSQAELQQLNRWVYCTGKLDDSGKRNKEPLNPKTKKRASTNNVKTSGPFQAAIRCVEQHEIANPDDTPFPGIFLGQIGQDIHLIGLDFDGCIDPETNELKDWAVEMLNVSGGYIEKSPSGVGPKSFHLASSRTVGDFKECGGINCKKEFKITSHEGLEMHMSGTYFTYTENQFEAPPNSTEDPQEINLDQLIDLYELGQKLRKPTIGKVAKVASKDKGSRKPGSRNNSGSAYGYKFAAFEISAGSSYEEYRDKILENEAEAGEWANRVDERQIERAYENAQAAILAGKQKLIDQFPDLAEEILDGLEPTNTEDHLAMSFIAKYGVDFKYDTDNCDWFAWTGQIWMPNSESLVVTLFRDLARRLDKALDKGAKNLLRASSIRGAMALAASDATVLVRKKDWDRIPHLLGVQNGVIDLMAGELIESKREYLISKRANASFDDELVKAAKFRGTLWTDFLNESFDANRAHIKLVRRFFGYSLTGEDNEEKFVYIIGPGGTGKSTFIDTFREMMGDYAAQIESQVISLSRLEQHSTSIARLEGYRLVCTSETKENSKMDLQIVKKMVSGDPLVARKMRQDEVQFDPRLKLVIVGNNTMDISGGDSAIRRRLIKLKMNQTATKPDHRLKFKLKQELDIVLAWAVAGAMHWYEDGLDVPKSLVEDAAEFINEQDNFHDWVVSKCLEDPSCKTPFSDLWQSCCSYFQINNLEPPSQRVFTDALREHGYPKI